MDDLFRLNTVPIDAHSVFVPSELNFVRSPVTGYTRAHWLASSRHMLEGFFLHVTSAEKPPLLPKLTGREYPWLGNLMGRQSERAHASFEALARSFNLASPLIAEDPEADIGGIKLRPYYARHILAALTDASSLYPIGKPDHSQPTQPIVEIGNLTLWFILQPEVIWNRWNKEERDRVAEALLTWANGPTRGINWRWFNIMALTFLDLNGYATNRERMNQLLDAVIADSVSGGWYRDHGFDYYIIHAYQLYASIWSKYYGRKHNPERAAKLDGLFIEFAKTYPHLFSRKGEVNLYGRSASYRCAATAGFAAAVLGDYSVDFSPGGARAAMSAALRQFIEKPELLKCGIPCGGFYMPFEHVSHYYSCSASAYAMFIGNVVLTLPAHHAFWEEKEPPNYLWSQIGKAEVSSCYIAGPKLLLSANGLTGTAEIRPASGSASSDCYDRLVYNTSFPYEKHSHTGPTAGTLVIQPGSHLPIAVKNAQWIDGVLYRQVDFGKSGFIDTASFLIPRGEIRIDRINLAKNTKVQLGHFALPVMKSEQVTHAESPSCLSIKSGNRSLALGILRGWNHINLKSHEHFNPESLKSFLLYCETTNHGLHVCMMLHETNGQPILFHPADFVTEILETSNGCTIRMKDSRTITISWPL